MLRIGQKVRYIGKPGTGENSLKNNKIYTITEVNYNTLLKLKENGIWCHYSYLEQCDFQIYYKKLNSPVWGEFLSRFKG